MLTGVFFGTAFTTILTPGPNMMYVGTNGAERGVAGGALAALAVVLGGVCYTVATAIGVAAAMAAHPALLTAIRAAGAAYLAWLGLRLLRRAGDRTPSAPLAPTNAGAFRGGLIISLTNPQLALFFLAFLPQFIVPGAGPVWWQLLYLGLVFNACSLMVNLGNAVITGAAGKAATGGIAFRRVMRALAGVVFLALAVRSAWELVRR